MTKPRSADFDLIGKVKWLCTNVIFFLHFKNKKGQNNKIYLIKHFNWSLVLGTVFKVDSLESRFEIPILGYVVTFDVKK